MDILQDDGSTRVAENIHCWVQIWSHYHYDTVRVHLGLGTLGGMHIQLYASRSLIDLLFQFQWWEQSKEWEGSADWSWFPFGGKFEAFGRWRFRPLRMKRLVGLRGCWFWNGRGQWIAWRRHSQGGIGLRQRRGLLCRLGEIGRVWLENSGLGWMGCLSSPPRRNGGIASRVEERLRLGTRLASHLGRLVSSLGNLAGTLLATQ